MKGVKPTLEEFKQDVYSKNEYYRKGIFEIIGEYKHSTKKILLMTKYGKCEMLPTHILKGCKITIKAAVNKHEYFCNILNEVNADYKNKKFIIVNKYKNQRSRLILKTRYGYCTGHSSNLLNNMSVGISSAIYPHYYYLQMLEHKNKAYRKRKFRIVSDYITSTVNINVKTKYGIHSIHPQNLLRNSEFSNKSSIDVNAYYIEKFKKATKNTYDYSNFNFIDSDTKIEIICEQHGSFYKRVGQVSNSPDCPICTQCILNNFKFSDWNKMCPGNPGTLYIIQCFNDQELFIKIGITCDSTNRRFHTNKSMPYNYIIIREIKNMDRRIIWNLEKEIKTTFLEQLYSPKIKFGGSLTECFKTEALDDIVNLTNPLFVFNKKCNNTFALINNNRL